MQADDWQIDGHAITVWTGGNGDPLLLIHGGWAGAAAHWSTVWEELAQRYFVIAPDLPGIRGGYAKAPRSYESYVTLLSAIVARYAPAPLHVCGNSLGASLGSLFAATYPERVRRLTLVNGYPPRPLPGAIRLGLRLPPLRQMARANLRAGFYSSTTLAAAFVHPDRAPAEIIATLRAAPDQLVDNMLTLLASVSTPCPTFAGPTSIVWGMSDRLPGLDLKLANRLVGTFPDARLHLIPDAGHLPQVENRTAFLAALLAQP